MQCEHSTPLLSSLALSSYLLSFHTLAHSFGTSIPASPFESVPCALFRKNTRGGGYILQTEGRCPSSNFRRPCSLLLRHSTFDVRLNSFRPTVLPLQRSFTPRHEGQLQSPHSLPHFIPLAQLAQSLEGSLAGSFEGSQGTGGTYSDPVPQFSASELCFSARVRRFFPSALATEHGSRGTCHPPLALLLACPDSVGATIPFICNTYKKPAGRQMHAGLA